MHSIVSFTLMLDTPSTRTGAALATIVASLFLGAATCAEAQTPQGPEFAVNTYTSGDQQSPSVAIDPTTGSFVVVWQSPQDGSYSGIFGQRFDSGGSPIGGEFQVNTYTNGPQSQPEVAVEPGGAFMVVWRSAAVANDHRDGSYAAVAGRHFDASGGVAGDEFIVNSLTTGGQESPHVTADGAGNFIVVWESDARPSGDDISAQRFDAGGQPLGGEFLVNSYTSSLQRRPRVSADVEGNFVVIWDEYGGRDGDARGVFGQRFDAAAAPVGGDFQVNTTTAGYQVARDVAMDANGKFVVVWESLPGIYGQRFDAGGAPLGDEFLIRSGPADASRVASDDQGNFVVVWRRSRIEGRLFDAEGNPVGGEFAAQESLSGFNPAVDMKGSTGDFVVAWQRREDGSTEDGVFARRFGSALVTPGAETPTPGSTATPGPTTTPAGTPQAMVGEAVAAVPPETSAASGELVSSGGFQLTNASNETVKVSCMDVDFGEPEHFDSGFVRGASGPFNGRAKAAPAKPSTFCFGEPLPIEPNGTGRFDLEVRITDAATARSRSPIVYASVWPTARPLALDGFLVLWLLVATARSKRAAAARIVLALVLLGAVSLTSSCGGDDDDSGGGGVAIRGVSTQRLTAVDAAVANGAVGFSGLPITIGSVEVR